MLLESAEIMTISELPDHNLSTNLEKIVSEIDNQPNIVGQEVIKCYNIKNKNTYSCFLYLLGQ